MTGSCRWLLALVVAAPPLAAQDAAPVSPFPSDSAVRVLIRKRVEEGRSAGIVVGLLEPDGRRRIVAYGDPGPGKLPLDGNSVFEIGSITKVFTGILLAQMVVVGEVQLDDPIGKFLPPGVKVPERNGIPIALSHLARHDSGLPRMPTNFRPRNPANPYADYTPQQLYEFLSTYTLPRDPGAGNEYSNVGVGLLGHVLALAAGQPYEDLQRERIWTPLGMSQTCITLTPWAREHLALGHSPFGNVVENWDIATLTGAGGIRSTANDMLRFLDANLRADGGPLGKAMALAQARHRSPRGTRAGPLTWATRVTARDTILWHNGGTAGYRTFIGMSRARKIAVVVLSNSGGEGIDDIGYHLLDPTLPLASKPIRITSPLLILALGIGLAAALVTLGVQLWRRLRHR